MTFLQPLGLQLPAKLLRNKKREWKKKVQEVMNQNSTITEGYMVIAVTEETLVLLKLMRYVWRYIDTINSLKEEL